jgi:EAL and modified HD-GYP domain-containing signal transduction protein
MIFFELLADAKLNPVAARLHVSDVDSSNLLSFLSNQSFPAFVARFPCLIGSDLAHSIPQDVLDAMERSGIQTVAEYNFHHVDAVGRPDLPIGRRWLSGDWDLAPPPKTTASHSASRALSLKLMQLVATDADTCEIEAIFRHDPVLAYHLLRLVNSLGMSTGRHISSFSQAILILGRQQLKRWLNLMLFAASRDDYRSAMLIGRVTVRARSMELLAKAVGLDRWHQEQAFMVGMFSLLGVLFGMPLADILGPLKLNLLLENALLRHDGEIGQFLRCVEASERIDEATVIELIDRHGLTPEDWNLLTLEAHEWMLGAIHDQPDKSDA